MPSRVNLRYRPAPVFKGLPIDCQGATRHFLGLGILAQMPNAAFSTCLRHHAVGDVVPRREECAAFASAPVDLPRPRTNHRNDAVLVDNQGTPPAREPLLRALCTTGGETWLTGRALVHGFDGFCWNIW